MRATRTDVEPVPADVLLAGVGPGAGDDGAGDERGGGQARRRRPAAGGAVSANEQLAAMGSVARTPARTAIRPNAIDTIASRKCDWTRKGCRSPSTAMPPTTPFARTETSTPIAGQRSPLPRGAARNPPDDEQHRRDADHPAEQTVELLDRGVPGRHVDEPLVVAVRPVVASEAAARSVGPLPRRRRGNRSRSW